jgi:hypothetical protein
MFQNVASSTAMRDIAVRANASCTSGPHVFYGQRVAMVFPSLVVL